MMKKAIMLYAVVGLGIIQTVPASAENFTVGAFSPDWSKTEVKNTFAEYLVAGLNKLQSSTGDSFHLVKYHSPQDLAKALAAGKVDVAYGKVETYFYAKKINAAVKILAIPYFPGKNDTTYRANFITLKDNKSINSWQDLQGKHFVFGKKYSLSGFVYPATFLQDQGKDFRQFLKSYSFANSHLDVMSQLVAKKAEAGVVWDSIYEHSALKNNFKIIYQIDNIPNPPLVRGAKLTEERAKKVQADLVKLPENSLAAFFVAGFIMDVPSNFYDEAFKKITQIEKMSSKFVE